MAVVPRRRGSSVPQRRPTVTLRSDRILEAEDPSGGLLPGTGTIRYLKVPSCAGGRRDGGVTTGTEVGLHYDPLFGRLIMDAPTREEVTFRMGRALDELMFERLESSTPLGRRVMDENGFQAGRLSIRYLEERLSPMVGEVGAGEPAVCAAASRVLREPEWWVKANPPRIGTGGSEAPLSPWLLALHPTERVH